MKRFLLTSAMCASILFSASAPSKQYAYEITPFAAGILSDSKINLKDDHYANAGLAIAKNFNNTFIDQVELSYLRSDSLDYNNMNAGNTNVNRMFLNLIKKLPITEKFAAYGLAGFGYQNVSQETSEHQDTSLFNYGIGLRYDLPYYGIALKSDIRHLVGLEESQNDLMYTLGLALPLGKKSNEEIKAVVPTIETPVAQVVDGDDDNDGVLNSKDLCPNSLPGSIVDENGCELDDDNDGVVNRLDKCPNTSEGIKVNLDGCVTTVNLNINFDYNSAKINNSYNADLTAFAEMLNENPNLTAVIEAHTDSIGSEVYNQNLSDKRANSVVKALNKLNIESTRLKSIGYGETQPVASNETAEGRAANRRVTALVNQ